MVEPAFYHRMRTDLGIAPPRPSLLRFDLDAPAASQLSGEEEEDTHDTPDKEGDAAVRLVNEQRGGGERKGARTEEVLEVIEASCHLFCCCCCWCNN